MLGQHVAHAQQADLVEQASLCTLAEAAARAREAEAEVEVALEAVAECDEQAETDDGGFEAAIAAASGTPLALFW